MEISGSIKVKSVQLHFAISGKIKNIPVTLGSLVKANQTVAELDSNLLQSYLERALKQYDKTRADFDKETVQNPTEFEKRILQNELDIAVKNVEIAKANLQETILTTPFTGIVADINPASTGINITPSQFSVTVIDPHSYLFQGEVNEKDILSLTVGKEMRIILVNQNNREIIGKVTFINPLPAQIKNPAYKIIAQLNNQTDLLEGMTAKAVA